MLLGLSNWLRSVCGIRRKEALDMLNDKSRPKACRKNLNGASPLASPRIRRKQAKDGSCAMDAAADTTKKDENSSDNKHLRVGSNVSSSRSTSESSTSGIDKGTSSSERSFSSPVLIPSQGSANDAAFSPESSPGGGKPQRPSYLELNGENLSPRKQKFGRAPHHRRRSDVMRDSDLKEDELMDEEESEELSYVRYFDSGDSFLATDDGLTTVTSSEGSPVVVGVGVGVGNSSALLKWRGAKLASQEDIGDVCEENEDGGSRRERTSSIITVDLHREGNSRLGLSLVSMETNDATGIYVKVVYPGSLADVDGRIQVGDKLLQINETDVKGMSVDEAIDLLRNQNGRVSLVLERENETSKDDDIKNRDTSSLGRSWSEQENLLSNEVSLLNAKNNNLSSADCLHWNPMTSDGNENVNRANDS
uniref:PDZ domain-containing protein n=1 Tax=Strigamia maritima TaxID=126957 RepID=T1IW85_STRMM